MIAPVVYTIVGSCGVALLRGLANLTTLVYWESNCEKRRKFLAKSDVKGVQFPHPAPLIVDTR